MYLVSGTLYIYIHVLSFRDTLYIHTCTWFPAYFIYTYMYLVLGTLFIDIHVLMHVLSFGDTLCIHYKYMYLVLVLVLTE